MRNIKLTIEYDGTNYAGWQRQKNTRRTIQETIEKALVKLFRQKINLIASGRTDAGVHAVAQIANFYARSKIPAKNIPRALNSFLPSDISIKEAKDRPGDFHSRFSAKSKTYRYLVLNQDCPSALSRNYAYYVPYKLDINKMRRASRSFLGRRDFSAFCASGSSAKDTVRTIKKISIKRGFNYTLSPPDRSRAGAIRYPLICIEITADGFLYNMARSIVGTLIEIARGKIEPAVIRKILSAKQKKIAGLPDRIRAGPTAPASGLYLVKVTY